LLKNLEAVDAARYGDCGDGSDDGLHYSVYNCLPIYFDFQITHIKMFLKVNTVFFNNELHRLHEYQTSATILAHSQLTLASNFVVYFGDTSANQASLFAFGLHKNSCHP